MKIPINLVTGSLQKREFIIGIYLGFENSMVSIVHPETKEPQVLKEFDASSSVPSVIYLAEAGQPVIGAEAVTYLETEPQNTVHSIKYLLGKSNAELQESNQKFGFKIPEGETTDEVNVQVKENNYSLTDLSSMLIRELKQRAEHILKTPVSKAVLTVPVYFDDNQKAKLQEAATHAGLTVISLVDEAYAACVAYKFQEEIKTEEILCVYYPDRYAFSFSVFKVSADAITLIASKHDIKLEAVMLAEDQDPLIVEEYLDKTLLCCDEALTEAELTPEQVSKVILIGKLSSYPEVREHVNLYFHKSVAAEIDPEQAVALGAAIEGSAKENKV